jgi:hypothetical protein
MSALCTFTQGQQRVWFDTPSVTMITLMLDVSKSGSMYHQTQPPIILSASKGACVGLDG